MKILKLFKSIKTHYSLYILVLGSIVFSYGLIKANTESIFIGGFIFTIGLLAIGKNYTYEELFKEFKDF